MLRPVRRIEGVLFALAFLACAYFHQGGGWNQNARFALVRAIVEQGTFFIDSYVIYSARPGSGPGLELVRHPVENAVFERDGRQYAVGWRDPRGRLVPVDPGTAAGRTLVDVGEVGASGDVAYYGGHFHPNKAPGTSFLAVPAYAVIYGIERLLGASPDRWWTLTVAAWLASVLSIGLLTAVGAVLLFRLARTLANTRDAALTGVVFVLGTMTWPHATLLFEHNIVAVGLLAAFYCIECARGAAGSGARPAWYLACAGACAGWAAISNYTVAAVVVLLWCHAIVRVGRRLASLPFALGLAGPFLLVCGYNWICFGTPFTTNYAYESPMFVAQHRLLGVFAAPKLDVLLVLLFSPFRGLFFTSPVLLLGVAGIVLVARGDGPRAWAWLTGSVTGVLLLLNASFNGWDAGWTAVPRYVGPAMPFLVLPIATVWRRWFRPAVFLTVVAVAIQLLLTAVDPQVPIGDLAVAGASARAVWRVNPLARYVLPVFVRGRPWPMLDETIDRSVEQSARAWAARGLSAGEVAQRAAELRTELHARVERGAAAPQLPLAGVVGPVSANPIGMYEAFYYRLAPPGSPVAVFNSFNVGELLWPQSRASLLPLLFVGGFLFVRLIRLAGAADEVMVAPTPASRPAARKTATRSHA